MKNPLHALVDAARAHVGVIVRARPRSTSEALAAVPGLVALAILAWMAWRIGDIVALRFATFHELEFQEGDVALNAMRVLNGQEQYPARDGNFIPLLYTPLYNHAVALVMWLSGSTALWTGRLVSILSTLGIMAVIAAWTWRESRSLLSSCAAPLVFASIAPLTGWWFDLCRVDMLFLFLTGAGAWALLDRREGDGSDIAKGIVAGVLLVFATLTKQTAGPLSIALCIVALPISPLRVVWTVTTASTLGFVALVHLYYTNTDFWFYCFEVLKDHPLNLWNWQERIAAEFFRPAGPLYALLLVGAVVLAGRRQWRLLLLLAVVAPATLMSMRGLLKYGGYVNQWLLAWMTISIALGIVMGWWIRPRPQWRGAEMLRSAADAVPPHALPGFIWLAIALWMAVQTKAVVLTYEPGARWPSAVAFPSARAAHLPQDLDGGQRVIDAIRDLPGSVWVMHFNYYAYLAGRPTEIGIDNVRDLTIGGRPVSPYALDLIQRREYDYLLINNVVLEADWLDPQVIEAIRANYEFAEDWESKYGFLALRPVDMAGQKPRALWRRKRD